MARNARPIARDRSWADYPRGVALMLGARTPDGTLPAWRAAIAGDVPRGAGLSSSAAIEAATAIALDSLFALAVTRRELAVLCRRVENEFLDVKSDAREDDLARLSGEELRYARHVISENARVLRAVAALEAGDFATFGQLMYASHASLRDDYQVSTPALDAFVDEAQAQGALGARLTGTGFGGCAIALVAAPTVTTLQQAVRVRFAMAGFCVPEFYRFHPARGAEVVTRR